MEEATIVVVATADQSQTAQNRQVEKDVVADRAELRNSCVIPAKAGTLIGLALGRKPSSLSRG